MKIITADYVASATGLHDCPAGDHPEVALAGRSNVGKSSLLNTLTGRKKLARTSNTPGRTRLINFFLINNAVHLVDLPGYGFARVPPQMRDQWGRMIESYLTRRKQLRGVIVLVDLRHKPTAGDKQMLDWLNYYGIPAGVAATKADKLGRGRALQNLKTVQTHLDSTLKEPPVLFSAVTGQGKDKLWDIIQKWTAG
ncbi:MAG: ribosome biogenesis GTP-binding protein YihA/YsxC [Firmicutes bacterium]|nr:ribosome biogenesis GTP-binding protein YihA/YsxC [Bacillota bacterium]